MLAPTGNCVFRKIDFRVCVPFRKAGGGYHAAGAEVRAAGLENGGGSIQPLVEAMTGAELTRARVYALAGYAEAR